MNEEILSALIQRIDELQLQVDYLMTVEKNVFTTVTVDDYLTAEGGVHVGGTSDPGTDNLVVDGNVYTAVWTDYSDTSTITGWSSYVVKEIYYKKVGKLVFICFYIDGTSDSTTTKFTIPYTIVNDPTTGNIQVNLIQAKDNSGSLQVGYVLGERNTTEIVCAPAITGGSWTASNSKTIRGQLWVEVQ